MIVLIIIQTFRKRIEFYVGGILYLSWLRAASCKKSIRKNNSIRKNKSTRKHIFRYKMSILVDLFFLVDLLFLIDFLHEAALNQKPI